MAIKMLKFAMNLTDDVGQQVLQVKPRLAYMTEEATEGRNAFWKT
jgi:1,4-dihydroxy-2-naphthoyl-CoA synthase